MVINTRNPFWNLAFCRSACRNLVAQADSNLICVEGQMPFTGEVLGPWGGLPNDDFGVIPCHKISSETESPCPFSRPQLLVGDDSYSFSCHLLAEWSSSGGSAGLQSAEVFMKWRNTQGLIENELHKEGVFECYWYCWGIGVSQQEHFSEVAEGNSGLPHHFFTMSGLLSHVSTKKTAPWRLQMTFSVSPHFSPKRFAVGFLYSFLRGVRLFPGVRLSGCLQFICLPVWLTVSGSRDVFQVNCLPCHAISQMICFPVCVVVSCSPAGGVRLSGCLPCVPSLAGGVRLCACLSSLLSLFECLSGWWCLAPWRSFYVLSHVSHHASLTMCLPILSASLYNPMNPMYNLCPIIGLP